MEELTISLMCFVDAAQDRANPSLARVPTTASPPTAGPSTIAPVPPAPPPKVITPDDFEDVSTCLSSPLSWY